VRKTIWRKVEFEHEFEKFTASVDISYTHDIIEGIFQKITEGVRVGWVKDKSGKIAVIYHKEIIWSVLNVKRVWSLKSLKTFMVIGFVNVVMKHREVEYLVKVMEYK